MASVRFLAALLCMWTVACTEVYGDGTTGHYIVHDSANMPCLLINVSATFSKVNISGTHLALVNGSIMDPKPIVVGTCAPADATVAITQTYINSTGQVLSATIRFTFKANKTSSTWNVTSMAVEFTKNDAASDLWEDGDAEAAMNNTLTLTAGRDPDLYNGASVNGSYQCNAKSTWKLMDGELVNGQLDIANFSAMVFNVEGANITSGPVTMCDADKSPSTSNVVPIAVGAALCGLVLIVLVAYVIGRSRHQRTHRGYQSV